MKNWIIVRGKDTKYLAVEDHHEGDDSILEGQGFEILAYVTAKNAGNAIECAEYFLYGE